MASPNMQAGGAPDPLPLMQMHFAFAPSFILAAGVQLDVFSSIAAGNKSAAEVARATGGTERGIRMLLDALVGFELLLKTNGQYGLSPLAAEYLVRGRPSYAGALLETNEMPAAWLQLADVIRNRGAARRIDQQEHGEKFFPALVRSLHVVNRPQAQRLATAVGAGATHGGLQVLDIACGSGVWGIAVAQADPEARITAQDFPPILEITKEYARKENVAGKYEYLAGDLKQVDLGESRYDVAILGHIVHSEGEQSSRELFRRVRRALKPGGRIVIIDMVPNDTRTGPPFPLLFALNMLVFTTEGDTYTLAEYARWLNDAGFGRVETADIGSHSPAIIATRD